MKKKKMSLFFHENSKSPICYSIAADENVSLYIIHKRADMPRVDAIGRARQRESIGDYAPRRQAAQQIVRGNEWIIKYGLSV